MRDHDKILLRAKRYRTANKEAINERNRLAWILLNERLENDPEFYAEYRKYMREKGKEYHDRKGRRRPFREKLSMRFPDWAHKGQEVIDRRSRYLRENFDKERLMEFDDYGYGLAMERRDSRESFMDRIWYNR